MLTLRVDLYVQSGLLLAFEDYSLKAVDIGPILTSTPSIAVRCFYQSRNEAPYFGNLQKSFELFELEN